jgi:hypothetical protein
VPERIVVPLGKFAAVAAPGELAAVGLGSASR